MKDIRIGRNIAVLRKKHNITQGQLAKDLHISPQAVSKWERGTCLPDTQTIPLIADYFHVSIDVLYRGEPVFFSHQNHPDEKTAINPHERITTKMKAIFDRQKLLPVLTAAEEILQNKNIIAAIAGLLFECPPGDKFGKYDVGGENVCRISAFAPEKGLRAAVECEICEKGACIVNADKMLQIVRALPDGEIIIAGDEKGKVTVSGGEFCYEITAVNTADTPDFPVIPMLTGDRVLTLPQSLVRRKIEETVFAVATKEQRPALNGALFCIKNGELTVVGCDGTRLAVSRCSLADMPNADIPDAEMIIPRGFLVELSKVLKDSEEEITVIIGWTHVIFKFENICFFTRMIQAEYMDYERVLPKSWTTQTLVSRRSMITALERMSLVANDNKMGSPVKLDIRNGCIELNSVSEESSVCAKVLCTMEGADLTIGFHCHMLLDALTSYPEECETLRIRLNAPLQGIVMESMDAPGPVCFVMPCRLDVKILGEFRKLMNAAD